jgi:succinate dehydrogenase hydrophobic anchor subunit
MRETKYWTWHMFAGILILVLLGGHMVYTHMGELTGFMRTDKASDGISMQNSQARDAKSWFPAYFIVLLAIALYHGLYGLRTILFELCPHRGAQKTMTAFLLLLGLALFGLGSFAAVKAHNNALPKRVDQASIASQALRVGR